MCKKALIIGVSGQDGAYLARLLLKKGYEVYGTSRDHEASSFTNLKKLQIKDQVQLRSMTASDFRSVLTILQEVEPDEIYNLAGQTSVGLSFSCPVEMFESISVGTIHILECLRLLKQKVRFYNAGSSEVFGNTLKPACEQTPFQPRSPYATAKAAAHYAVSNYREAYGLFACTGILFNHESPLRSERFVTKKIISTAVRIARGSKERLKLGNLAIHRDWGWAPEYVEAMWKILQYEIADDFIIATGQMHSLEEFIQKTFSQLGLESKDHVDSEASLFRPSDIAKSVGNPTKAATVLKWRAEVLLDEIVALLIEDEIKKTSC
ncbi:MAG: GDP-mannose 4,6-dehydratase [Chthoniobacterales bacterium]